MRIMHDMAKIASQTGSGAGRERTEAPGSPSGPHRRTPVRGQIETMWQGGMSTTAIRRALGLTADEALAAGIFAPAAVGGRCGPARQSRGGRARPPRDRRPKGTGETDPGGGAARDTAQSSQAQSSQAGPAMIGVLNAVAQVSKVPAARLLGSGQERRQVRPRHLAMYLLRELCAGASLPAIGHFLGRDHTTVLYGCRRAEDLLARDAGFRSWRDGALYLLKKDPDGGSPAQRPVLQ